MNFNDQYTVTGASSPSQGVSVGFDKKTAVTITALLVVLAILLTFIITFAVLDGQYQAAYDAQLDKLGQFREIIDMYQELPEEGSLNRDLYEKLLYIDYMYRTFYVGEIDEEELIYTVLNGYIAGAGDQYGTYYTADGFSTAMGEAQGNSVGIGIYVSIDEATGGVKILYVMKDGPANKAGLIAGDVITHVNGESVNDLGYYRAIDMVKGESGTNVILTILRDGKSSDYTLTRANVEAESIIYSKHQNDPTVGVIRIIDFNNSMPQQFYDAVEELINGGCKSLVFDLRNNPGGTLTSVLEILDYLLPKGTLVSIKYAQGGETDVYASDESGLEFNDLYGEMNIKMAVLVNGNTASAAELFTCALKDYERAIIVGEKTYGKGCGQTVTELPDKDGLAITTFYYDPPKSKNYNGIGIEPNIVEPLNEEAASKNIFELEHSEDNQLSKALEALK